MADQTRGGLTPRVQHQAPSSPSPASPPLSPPGLARLPPTPPLPQRSAGTVGQHRPKSHSQSTLDPTTIFLPFPAMSSSENTTNRSSDERSPSPDPRPRLRSALKINSLPPSASSNPPCLSPGLGEPSSLAVYPRSSLQPQPTPKGTDSFSPRPTLNRTRSSGEILPPGYQRRVGFSTMETEEPTKGGGTGAEYSFTLQAKSSNYVARRDSRCFLVATDGEDYSIQALDWLMSSLVEHGDEVVVLRVIEHGGSILENEEQARNEAQEVLKHVLTKNDREITVTVEFVIGSAIKTIQRMLEVYRPDSLVVGTRGRSPSAWQKAFSLGSTSQYLVARSPVPVIVVRPEQKVRKSREARAKDPKRQSYQALLGTSHRPIGAVMRISSNESTTTEP